jgi:hypothetical protein
MTTGAHASTGETDNTGGANEVPFAGTPAAIIGTSNAGPAFVPRMVNSESTFTDTFGDVDSSKWGTVAVQAWYTEAQNNAGLVYLRVLGVGNGRAKGTNNVVSNAGFVVGAQQVHDELDKKIADEEGFGTVTVGAVDDNPYANETTLVSVATAATATIKVVSATPADYDANGGQIAFTLIGGDASTTTKTYQFAVGGALSTGGTSGLPSGTVRIQVTGLSTQGTIAAQIVAAIEHSNGHGTAILTCALSTVTNANDTITITQANTGTGGNTTIAAMTNGNTSDMTVNGVITQTAFSGGNNEARSPAKPGRMYFLSTIMSQSAGSTYLTDAGLNGSTDSILRAVIMVASGVQLQLSGWNAGNPHGGGASAAYDVTGSAYAYDDSTGAKDLGNWVGSMNNSQQVKLILNGQKLGPAAPADGRILSVGLNPGQSSYLGSLNTDPTKLEEKGHYLYAHYPVPGRMALPNTSSVVHSYSEAGATYYHNTLLTTGSSGRNTYGAGVYKPNYEGWETRFKTPFTPWVISQAVGGTESKLFRLHALDDGQGAEDQLFVQISNIIYPADANEYSTFDVLVRSYGDQTIVGGSITGNTTTQAHPSSNTVHPTSGGSLAFTGVNLNPDDTNYIGRVIGDYYRYYDFDAATNEQKLVIKGLYENTNRFVRVEVSDAVAAGNVPKNTLPFGHQGAHHLVTSGSNDGLKPIQTGQVGGGDKSGETIFGAKFGEYALGAWTNNAGMGMIQPPVPMRIKTQNEQNSTIFPWGMRFDNPTDGFLYTTGEASTPVSLTGTSISTTSDQKVNNTDSLWTKSGGDLVRQLNKFFPSYAAQPAWVGDNAGTANTANASVLDANEFNLNKFTLGRVYVRTFTNVSSEVKPDTSLWHQARYIRNGASPGTAGFRFLTPSDLKNVDGNANYTRFILPFQGGFDGLNSFSRNKTEMNHWAAHHEQTDSTNQGGLLGPTVAAYRKAIDIISEKADIDINALVIPDQRSTFVTNYAAEKMEERFDAIYIMDIENCSQFGAGNGQVLFHGNPSSTYLSSGAAVNTFYTIERFAARGLSNSFAAAYYPNIMMSIKPPNNPNADPETFDAVPASIGALMAFARTEKLEGAWGTPAGSKNGAPSSIIQTQVELEPKDNNDLYANSINPIIIFKNLNTVPELSSAQDHGVAGSGVIMGQKTLLNTTSALNRLDVRKLMVYIRRKVRDIALNVLFEPNQPNVLSKMSAQVESMLENLVAVEAVKQFRVVIDDTTTSQADIENNTVRGKVFVQPYRSTEIIAIDVSLENAGSA